MLTADHSVRRCSIWTLKSTVHNRHARPCAGHRRLSTLNAEKVVDGRDKSGHNEEDAG
jgi:hypothetical protein